MTEPPDFVVSDLDDLRRLAGPGCTLGDVAVLWRLLREAGRLRPIDAGRTVVVVSGREELDAWVIRARVAARRERSALAGAADLPDTGGSTPDTPV